MKYTGQDIPPELLSAYKELISNASATMPIDGTARTRQGARMSQQRDRTKADRWQWAAEKVYEQIKGLKDVDTGSGFISEEKNRLRNGIFNTAYWIPANILTPEYLKATASNTTDPTPPPYDYRNPANKPSIVTYPDGTLDSAPMSASGATVGDQWNDNSLTWRRTTSYLMTNGTKPAELPIIWATEGTMTVDASDRPSRPMLSLKVKAFLSDIESTLTSPISPPLDPAISLYWPYEIPPSVAPFYHAQIPIIRKEVLNGSIIDTSTTLPERLTVLTAPFPMQGKGYNNNTSVTTSYTDQEYIFQLHPCLQKEATPGQMVSLRMDWWTGSGWFTSATEREKTKAWPAGQINWWKDAFYRAYKPEKWYQRNDNLNFWKIRNYNQPAPSGYHYVDDMKHRDITTFFGSAITCRMQKITAGRNIVDDTSENSGYTIDFQRTECAP